jgi:hypothetical protein
MRPARAVRSKRPFSPAPVLRAGAAAAAAALADAAVATGTVPGQDGRLTSVLGGFVIVAAVVLVFMGVRRSAGRRRGDKDVFDAIDDFIEGDSDAGGDGGSDGGGD